MTKHLVAAVYSPGAAESVVGGGGTNRQMAMSRLVASVGGVLDVCYFGSAEASIVFVADLPGDEALAALVFTLRAAGAFGDIQVRSLVTAEQLDDAMMLAPANVDPLPREDRGDDWRCSGD